MTSNRIIIEPGRAEKNYWKDLWHFRELFYILSWRDIKVRYKQTVIGAAWSIIRQLLTTIIFTIVFSRVAKLGSPSGHSMPSWYLPECCLAVFCQHYQRLTVPPGIWVAFSGEGPGENIVLNIASIPHDPVEAETLPWELDFALTEMWIRKS